MLIHIHVYDLFVKENRLQMEPFVLHAEQHMAFDRFRNRRMENISLVNCLASILVITTLCKSCKMIPYTLQCECRMTGDRSSRLICISGYQFCASWRVQEQSAKMTT